MLIENVLAVDVPMISAVNGPCNIHFEVPLLGDIVLASEDAYFQDLAHFPRGMVPGDGQHVIWPAIVGPQPGAVPAPHREEAERAGSARMGRGQRGASQGPAPRPRVGAGARAREAAAARRCATPACCSRRTSKRAFLDELGHGIARETYAQRQFFPVGGGMAPLDRPWDKEGAAGHERGARTPNSSSRISSRASRRGAPSAVTRCGSRSPTAS